MSRDGHGYLAHNLGKGVCHLRHTTWACTYVTGTLGMWSMLEQLECRLGIVCVPLQALTRRVGCPIMGKIICYVGGSQGMSYEGH